MPSDWGTCLSPTNIAERLKRQWLTTFLVISTIRAPQNRSCNHNRLHGAGACECESTRLRLLWIVLHLDSSISIFLKIKSSRLLIEGSPNANDPAEPAVEDSRPGGPRHRRSRGMQHPDHPPRHNSSLKINLSPLQLPSRLQLHGDFKLRVQNFDPSSDLLTVYCEHSQTFGTIFSSHLEQKLQSGAYTLQSASNVDHAARVLRSAPALPAKRNAAVALFPDEPVRALEGSPTAPKQFAFSTSPPSPPTLASAPSPTPPHPRTHHPAGPHIPGALLSPSPSPRAAPPPLFTAPPPLASPPPRTPYLGVEWSPAQKLFRGILSVPASPTAAGSPFRTVTTGLCASPSDCARVRDQVAVGALGAAAELNFPLLRVDNRYKTSVFRGVSRDRRGGTLVRWRARIKNPGDSSDIMLGSFATSREAAAAFDRGKSAYASSKTGAPSQCTQVHASARKPT